MIERTKKGFRARISVDLGEFDAYEQAARAIKDYYHALAGEQTEVMFCPCCGQELTERDQDWLEEGRY